MALEFFVVTGGSLALGLLSVPLLGLGQAVELCANATTGVVVKVGEAIEVRDVAREHLC